MYESRRSEEKQQLKWCLRSQGPPIYWPDLEEVHKKRNFRSPKFKPVESKSGVAKPKTRTRRATNKLRNNVVQKDADLVLFQKISSNLTEKTSGQTYGQFYFHTLEMLKEEEVYEALTFVKQLPRLTPDIRPPSLLRNGRRFVLPHKQINKQKTLVLDLDETLVHASIEALETFDFQIEISLNGESMQVYVKCRPYLKQFLSAVAQEYEVVVFTASLEAYADNVLDKIDPQKKFISHRLFRDSCVCISGNYLKNLAVLGRDLVSTIIVDNSLQAFGYQLDNAVPIVGYTDDPSDTELIRMWSFLLRASQVRDVRDFIKSEIDWQRILNQIEA